MLLDLCCGRLILKGLCVDHSECPCLVLVTGLTPAPSSMEQWNLCIGINYEYY